VNVGERRGALPLGSGEIAIVRFKRVPKGSDVVSKVSREWTRVVLSIVNAAIGGEPRDDDINPVKRVACHNPHGEQRRFHVLSRKGMLTKVSDRNRLASPTLAGNPSFVVALKREISAE
jgi:hypothetical protein